VPSHVRSGPLKVKGWQDYFHGVNGNLTQFNAFMHNKNQLYVADLTPYQSALDRDAVPYMRRVSKYPSRGYMLAHLSLEVAGRIVELVGPYVCVSVLPVLLRLPPPSPHRLALRRCRRDAAHSTADRRTSTACGGSAFGRKRWRRSCHEFDGCRVTHQSK
jgi:hypothetical protein